MCPFFVNFSSKTKARRQYVYVSAAQHKLTDFGCKLACNGSNISLRVRFFVFKSRLGDSSSRATGSGLI